MNIRVTDHRLPITDHRSPITAPHPRLHGSRLARPSIVAAVGSPRISSVSGFQRILRPSVMAITHRCPTLAERCATSAGVIVGRREMTQSMKLPMWLFERYRLISSGPDLFLHQALGLRVEAAAIDPHPAVGADPLGAHAVLAFGVLHDQLDAVGIGALDAIPRGGVPDAGLREVGVDRIDFDGPGRVRCPAPTGRCRRDARPSPSVARRRSPSASASSSGCGRPNTAPRATGPHQKS